MGHDPQFDKCSTKWNFDLKEAAHRLFVAVLVAARVPAGRHRPLWLGARLTGGLVNPEWAGKTQFTWGRQRVGLWHPHWLPPGPASALSTSAALHCQGNCAQQICISHIGHSEVSNDLYFRKATSQHGNASTSALRLPRAFRASIWDRKPKAPRPRGGTRSHTSPVGLSFQACPSLRRWVTQSSHFRSTDPHNHKTVFGTKTLMWACFPKTFISACMDLEDSTLSEIRHRKTILWAHSDEDLKQWGLMEPEESGGPQ